MQTLIRVILTVLVSAIVIALAALSALSYSLWHPDTLKPVAIYFVEKATGRRLELAGPVVLNVSMQPAVSVANVRLSNPEWASAPDLLAADRIRARFDLIDLVRGQLNLLELEIEGGAVHLEESADGARTWDLGSSGLRESPAVSWRLQSAQLTSTTVVLLLPEQPPRRLQIVDLVERGDAIGALDLNGRGTINDFAWQLQGSIGTLEALLSGGSVDLDLDLDVDSIHLAAAGHVANLSALTGLDLTMSLEGPDATVYGELLGVRDAFVGDVALYGSLQSSADGAHLSAHGNVAAFQIDVDGTIRDLRSFEEFTSVFSISGPEARVFSIGAATPAIFTGPFEVRGRQVRRGRSVVLSDVVAKTADTELELQANFDRFPSVEGATGQLRFKGADLSRYAEVLGNRVLPAVPYTLDIQLKDFAGTVAVTLRAGSHTLSADGVLGSYPDFRRTRLDLRAVGEDFQQLSVLAGLGDGISGHYSASGTLSVVDRELRFGDFQVATEPAVVSGNMRLNLAEQSGELHSELGIQLGNLAWAGRLFGIESLPESSVQATVALDRTGGHWRLKSSEAEGGGFKVQAHGGLGSLRDLSEIDLVVGLEGESLNRLVPMKLPDWAGTRPFRIETTVRGLKDSVELIDFKLVTEENSIRLQGHFPVARSLVGADVRVDAQGKNLAAILPSTGFYQPPHAAFRIQGELANPESDVLQLRGLEVSIGAARVRANGAINLVAQTTTALDVVARGPSLRQLGTFLELPADGPFVLEATLSSGRQAIELTRVAATWGDNDLSGSGRFDWSGKVPEIVVRGVSQRVHLTEAISPDLESQPKPAADRMIPSTPLPFARLGQFNAEVDFTIGDFAGLGEQLTNVAVAARLENGLLEVSRFDFQDRHGSFAGAGLLRRLDDGAEVELRLNGTDLTLELLTNEKQPAESVPRHDIALNVAGQGGSLAEMAGSLNGSVLISTSQGLIDNRALELLGRGFFQSVVGMLNPFVKTERYTQVDCAVLNSKITAGTLALKPGLVIRTTKLNMLVTGRANLADESLDLSLATQPRTGVGISPGLIVNPFFKVGGTFAAPSLRVDSQNAALAYAAAAATGGLSILAQGFWDRFKGESNPCDSFRQGVD